jgi:MFS family permease
MSRTSRQRSILGVIAAMAVVNLVYGITFPLLALVLDAQGVSNTLIGINTIVQAAAIIVVAPFAPQLMQKYRPARMMQGIVVGLAGLFILAGWFPNVWFWFPLRFIIGAMTAMLWIASEAVINDLAEESWRGRIIGIYSAVGAAGFALGPLLLIATGHQGMVPFVSTSILTLVAALPLFWSSGHRVHPENEVRSGLIRIILLAPAIMLGNVVYAASVESISTFFPLFGQHLGLASHVALGLMTVMGVGGMVMAFPLSWMADHLNRMGMLLACVILTMAGLLVMPLVVSLPWASVGFAFVFGGTSGMIYTLGVILIGEQFKGASLAIATTAFTACWGTGSVIGPLLVGAGMDWFGAEHMALIIFVIFLPYLPFPLRAWLRSRRLNVEKEINH